MCFDNHTPHVSVCFDNQTPHVSVCFDNHTPHVSVCFDNHTPHVSVCFDNHTPHVSVLFTIPESDIDVANTLMSLKRGLESRPALKCKNGWPRSRSPSPPEFGSEQDKHLLREKHRWEEGWRGRGLSRWFKYCSFSARQWAPILIDKKLNNIITECLLNGGLRCVDILHPFSASQGVN